MIIEFHRNFPRNYKKRFRNDQTVKKAYEKRLRLFIKNPRHPLLDDHALKGSKRGYRAFSVTGDIRVVYLKSRGIFYFVDIGTHNQVY